MAAATSVRSLASPMLDAVSMRAPLLLGQRRRPAAILIAFPCKLNNHRPLGRSPLSSARARQSFRHQSPIGASATQEYPHPPQAKGASGDMGWPSREAGGTQTAGKAGTTKPGAAPRQATCPYPWMMRSISSRAYFPSFFCLEMLACLVSKRSPNTMMFSSFNWLAGPV